MTELHKAIFMTYTVLTHAEIGTSISVLIQVIHKYLVCYQEVDDIMSVIILGKHYANFKQLHNHLVYLVAISIIIFRFWMTMLKLMITHSILMEDYYTHT